MARHYYAAEHRYGVNICNDYCVLYRFASARKRDEYVSDANWHEAREGGYKTEAITAEEARRQFPMAFKLSDGEVDMSWWLQEYDGKGENAGPQYWTRENKERWWELTNHRRCKC